MCDLFPFESYSANWRFVITSSRKRGKGRSISTECTREVTRAKRTPSLFTTIGPRSSNLRALDCTAVASVSASGAGAGGRARDVFAEFSDDMFSCRLRVKQAT